MYIMFYKNTLGQYISLLNVIILDSLTQNSNLLHNFVQN